MSANDCLISGRCVASVTPTWRTLSANVKKLALFRECGSVWNSTRLRNIPRWSKFLTDMI
jgi:hypothetical protein